MTQQSLCDEILQSKNFKGISPSLVKEIIRQECADPHRKNKEIIKRAKAKLHQVGNAFRVEQMGYRRMGEQFSVCQTQAELREFCLKFAQEHASTKERLPRYEAFYQMIFAELPHPPARLLDLACGLHPLMIPFFQSYLAPNFRYDACDLYQDIATMLNHFFQAAEIHGNAFQTNLLTNFPLIECDVTLLLKTIPCLEQVEKNAGVRILSAIRSPYAIISYPTASLTGKQKGMKPFYESHFLGIIKETDWEHEKLTWDDELVFLLKRK